MRAIVIRQHGEPEGMSLEERPAPIPGANQVLVDVKSIGVNYPDLLVIGGQYQVLPALPFTPGKDAAGIVQAVGAAMRSRSRFTRTSASLFRMPCR